MTHPGFTIMHQEAVSVASEDYVNENGFYFYCTTGGNVAFCAFNDKTDAEALTKTIASGATFMDAEPVYCRKILHTGTTASGIIIGTCRNI
jgi:hypothetical protein